VTIRYQIAIASLGGELREQREALVRTIVDMGHWPVDLTATGVLDRATDETLSRHLTRTDYFVLVVSPGAGATEKELDCNERAYDLAVRHGVPVLCLVVRGTAAESESARERPVWPAELEKLVDRLGPQAGSMVDSVAEVTDSVAIVLNRLIDTYARPGWVGTAELPPVDVAAELARLTKENSELKERGPEADTLREARLEEAKRSLQQNKILIPLWSRGTSSWEKPIEMTLYNFFVRIAPEMAVEMSSAEAGEFIPFGVCDLEPDDARTSWTVPRHALNLWLTDLMALDLVKPSKRKRAAKDRNQYWTITRDGRDLLSVVRRSVLESGGHRHVGFTKEYPIAALGNLGGNT